MEAPPDTTPLPSRRSTGTLSRLSASLRRLSMRRSSRTDDPTTPSAPKTPADVLAAPVSSLMRPQAVLTLAPGDTVSSALKALADRRVLSAPVAVAPDGALPPSTTPEFAAAHAAAAAAGTGVVCFVDVRDVVMSFLEAVPAADYGPASRLISRVKKLEDAGAALADAPLASLPVVGTDGAFVRAADAASMTLAALLADVMLVAPATLVREGGAPRARAAAHRVAVLAGGGGGVTCIVSQMDVARHLLTHVAALGPLARRSAADLGWASGNVVTVRADEPAVRALAAMRAAGVAGVAVVDGAGAMVGTFAFPDLRAMVADHLGSLGLPVAEFLARSRGREFWGVSASSSFSGASPSAAATDAAAAAAAAAVILSSTPTSGGGGGPVAVAAAAAAARRASIGGRVGQEVVTATPDEPYSALLARLVARRVHRLHVVDAETAAPVGVVTLTDALAAAAAAVRAGGDE